MPPLPRRVWPAWAASAISRALPINSDSAAATSIVEDGIWRSLTGAACRSGGSAGPGGLRRPRRQLVLGSLGAQLDRRRVAALLGPALLRFGAEAGEKVVGVRRVVGEEEIGR